MIKVFNCYIDIKKAKPEYKEFIDNIFWLSKAETIYELWDWLHEDVQMLDIMNKNGLVPNNDRTKKIYEVRKSLMEQVEAIESVLEEEIYVVDLETEEIYKEKICNLGLNPDYPIYLLKAIHNDEVEEGLKMLEDEVLNDPYCAMTWKDACKKAVKLLEE